LYRDKIPWSDSNYTLLNISEALKISDKFDIIHNHASFITYYFEPFIKKPIVHTLHSVLSAQQKYKQCYRMLKKYKKNYFVSISNSQRKVPELNYVRTVYNGICVNKFPFNASPEDYLIWVGRIKHNKGTAEAIKVAKKLGKKLLLIGKIDYVDEDYYKAKVKPHIDGKQIVYLGEMNRFKSAEYVKNAIALLNPINWREPFGLVMTEAMACGTPVIAFNRGSVPEIVVDNKTGFIVNNIKEMVAAVKKIDKIKRADCRTHVEKKFDAERMVDGYVEVYKKILREN